MTVTTSNWGRSVIPGLRKWSDDEFKRYAPKYPKLLHVSTSQRKYEEEVDSTGIGKLTESDELGATIFQDPLQGYLTRFTPRVYKAGIQLSRESFDDDLYGGTKTAVTKLSKAAARSYDYYAMGELFHKAFDTAFTSYGDALPLCSTVHTRIDGGSTQSNASSTGITLTEQNLNTGLLDVREVLDGVGEIVDMTDDKPILMITNSQAKLAREVLGSSLRSATSDNDVNYYRAYEDFDLFVNPWYSSLTWAGTRGSGSDLYWFIILKESHKLNFTMRVPFETNQEVDKVDTHSIKHSAYTRFTYGWGGWQGVWGSKADGAAYSS